MNDTTLTYAIRNLYGINPTQSDIAEIKQAIATDNENDRLFCKQVMKKNLADRGLNAQGSNFTQ